MRFFTLKRQMLFAMFVVFGCLAIHAVDDELITKQITVKLDEAGTLPDKIGSTKKYQITNLKIVGEINGRDLQLIRDMAGCDDRGSSTKGKLAILDLVEARIVSGEYYYYESCNTHDDIIGNYAFYGCHSLTSLSLPEDITSIGNFAFYGCHSLTSLSLPEDITSIGSFAFYGCRSLTSLSLPEGITSIWNYTFYDCCRLANFSLPNSIASIGDCAFYGCRGLTSLSFPRGITSIAQAAFYDCSGLTSIYVYAEKLPKMGSHVFDGCEAEKCTLYVPKGTYDDYWLSEFGYFDNIVEFDATGIDNATISTDAKEVSRYTVNGQRLSAPSKGLNIVKYSDGSVKKVAVQ